MQIIAALKSLVSPHATANRPTPEAVSVQDQIDAAAVRHRAASKRLNGKLDAIRPLVGLTDLFGESGKT